MQAAAQAPPRTAHFPTDKTLAYRGHEQQFIRDAALCQLVTPLRCARLPDRTRIHPRAICRWRHLSLRRLGPGTRCRRTADEACPCRPRAQLLHLAGHSNAIRRQRALGLTTATPPRSYAILREVLEPNANEYKEGDGRKAAGGERQPSVRQYTRNDDA